MQAMEEPRQEGKMARSNAVEDIIVAYVRATGPLPLLHSTHESYAKLQEEMDDLWDAIKAKQTTEQLRQKAVQVGAMALAFILECCDG